MDNFNQPNNNQNENGYGTPSRNIPDGEYHINYPAGSNVYRMQEAQRPAYPYDRSYAPQQSAGSSGSDGRKTVKVVLATVAICALLTLAVCAGIGIARHFTGSLPLQKQEDVTLEVTESPSTNIDFIPSSGEKLTYAQIAAKFRCAVVSVTVYYDAYGWGRYVYSEGSGFIIDEQGYIVTNSHVIDDDNYDQFKITVTIADENGEMNEVPAEVIGNDARTDLAVLKVDPDGLGLVVSELGQSSALVLGDEVVAIGNPGGSQFAGSITNGIISGIDRIIDSDAGTSDSAMKYLQTNAAISPGNSGGPLLNMYGQVIGINTAKIVDDGYESLGFAIPIDTALPIIQEIIEVGSFVRPALGVSCSEITKQTSLWYDVPEGLLIRGFYSNSAMPGAGVQVGDIIVACDGAETLTLIDLQAALESKAVGDTVILTVFRSGHTETFDFNVPLIGDNDLGELQQAPGRP